MAWTDAADPYLDPETGVLRNKVGARTKVALDELRAIHRQLFQDVYVWAGELRTVDVRKNYEGAEPFLPASMIKQAAHHAASELREDNGLRGIDRDRFVERLSYHYDQFNYIHPFREGNGRTQRMFWNRITADAGWQLDWRYVRGETNDSACRAAAEQRDFAPMHSMFDQITSKASPSAKRDHAWWAAERDRLSFPAAPSHDVPSGRAAPANAEQPTPGTDVARERDELPEPTDHSQPG